MTGWGPDFLTGGGEVGRRVRPPASFCARVSKGSCPPAQRLASRWTLKVDEIDETQLDVKLSSPGGPGNGANPEQLFAAGWSACFLSAIKLVAGKGGHFAAWEQPELFAAELRAPFKSLR
jgi:hypothetical protein